MILKCLISSLIFTIGTATTAFANEQTASLTTNCSRLEYPSFQSSSDGGAVLQKVSATDFTVSYQCLPVTCLYYYQKGIFSSVYGIYLVKSWEQHPLQSVNVYPEDPNVIVSGIKGRDAAIQAAKELVGKGICLEFDAMPFPRTSL